MQYGYLGGDLVLRQCAEIITQTIRGEDLAARLSGTAFAISLPETSMEIAASAQQRIMSLINHTPLMVSHEHPPVKMEVSTGIIAIETGKTVEETIKALHAVSKQEPKIKAA
jgi:diguanylate cyclase (GGDEF)-like protein